MRLPIPFLLYVGSFALLGESGWLFYQAQQKAPNGESKPTAAAAEGRKEAEEARARGRSSGGSDARWIYASPWWEYLKLANFTAKEPPPPPPPPGADKPVEVPKPTFKPVAEIIELVYLLADEAGSETQVQVRYLPEANVQPPPEVLKRMAEARGDAQSAPPPRRPAGTQGNPKQPTTPMPTAPTLGIVQYVQTVKVGESLWPPYADIELVKVADDAESAFFRHKSTGGEGKEPQVEELIKNSMRMDQQILKELVEGRRAERLRAAANARPDLAVDTGNWIEHEDTTRVGDTYHIGTRDHEQMERNFESMLEQVNLDSYRGGNLQGIKVRDISSQVSQKFGVQQGDVILAINGEAVRSRSDAISIGKKQYNRGVRLFSVRFLSAGQIVERNYQAPNKK